MNELIVILIIFVASYFLILKDFGFSIYILMILSVLLHKELFSFYRWDLMPIRAFMVAVLCAGITKLYFSYYKKGGFKLLFSLIKDPFIISLLVLWFVQGISIFFSLNLQASLLKYAFSTTIMALGIYIYTTLKNDPEKILKYLKTYIFIVFILTLFGYFQLFLYAKTGNIIGALWNVPGKISRVGATFWDVNHYGSLIAVLTSIVGILILVEKGWKTKIFNIVMFSSMAIALLLTNSRSAWILAFGAFITFATIMLIRKVGSRGILYVVLSLVLVSLPLLYIYSIKSSPFRATVKQYFHYRMDSFDSHFMLLTGAYQVFEKYPILGGGYGSFFEHFSKTDIAPTYFGRDPAALNTRVPAHTIWGELLSETGYLGLLSYLSFSAILLGTLFYISLKSNEKKDYMLSAVMFASILGWYVAGIFYSYNSEFFWIIMFLFMSWSFGTLQKLGSFDNVFNFFLKSKNIFFTTLAVIAAVLIFGGLGNTHLVPWDEAIYAKISKNMVLQNEFISQYWKPGQVWYEKPPLYMWFMALSMKFIGFNSWGARLPSALFGFLLILLIYKFGKKLFNRTAGFIAAFSLLTTVHFLYYARASMLDVTAMALITFSLYIYYLAKEKDKKYLWALSGLFIGLAVMTKGVIGLLPFPIIGLYELFLIFTKNQKLSKNLFLNYVLLFVTSVVVFLPWHLEMYRRYGNEFINNYIVYHVWDRATSAIEDKGKPFFWYFTVMRVSMRVWLLFLLASLPLILKKVYEKDSKIVLLFIWAAFSFLFFSVAKSKLVWYIFPMYPATALIVGYFIEKIIGWLMTRSPKLNNPYFKCFLIVTLVLSYLFYLFLNRELVYTSDLTGDQAKMMELKNASFDVNKKVYVDRMELPLVLFYMDGPFEIIDFHPGKIERVPSVAYNEELILITKTGRFSETVVGWEYEPKVVGESGDWILWYFEPKYEHDNETLDKLEKRIKEMEEPNYDNFDLQEYTSLKQEKETLLQKIDLGLVSVGVSDK